VANQSILKQGSLQLGNVGWFWRIWRLIIAPDVIIQRTEIWRLKYQRGYFKSESQFNYLFTLKNAHLSSNS